MVWKRKLVNFRDLVVSKRDHVVTGWERIKCDGDSVQGIKRGRRFVRMHIYVIRQFVGPCTNSLPAPE